MRNMQKNIKLILQDKAFSHDFKVLAVTNLNAQESNIYCQIAQFFDVCLIDASSQKMSDMLEKWQPDLIVIDLEYAGKAFVHHVIKHSKQLKNKIFLYTLDVEHQGAFVDNPQVDYISKTGFTSLVLNKIKNYASVELRSRELQLSTISLNEELDRVHHSSARELHDEFGGLLSSMMLKLYSMQEAIKRGDLDKAATLDCCEQIEKLVMNASATVKTICIQNRQPYFENGLLGQLDELFKTLEIEVYREVNTTAIKLISSFDQAKLFQTYRIIQESLNNVQYHSQAAEAFVTFKNEAAALVVEIVDHGIGFDQSNKIKKTSSFGLLGMNERAKSIGANLTIESEMAKGTYVRLEVPTQVLS